ncbi:MAG: hypothetical protein KKA62_00210 [Nanoarchaeota archaeon]|nr:hypothetical protein [Nanoarchaeota archaeon]MBU1644312.1 hypothetical protein [Nanoarchaeota archaeon]MBU1976359.1 hypothetical protein [Nanoarchaeota archaeon]
MSWANLITIFRTLILLPIIIYLIFQNSFLSLFLAVVLLGIAIFSDVIELVLLKKKEIKSFLHPFSDKMILLVLLFIFVLQGFFSKIFLILFLLRDLIIGVLRMVASRDDIPMKGADNYGKIITILQYFLVFGVFFGKLWYYSSSLYLSQSVDIGIMVMASLVVLLGFFSIIHYSFVYGRYRRKISGKKVEVEEMVILTNRKSGGYRNSYRRRLLRVFARRRKAIIKYLPSGEDMFVDVEKKITGAKQVIIAGGDGSFESALNNNQLKKKSLGFFPLGAGNSFYSYFYKGKRFEYLRSRFKFQEVKLDVLELESELGKQETLFLSLGGDAEVTRRIKDKKHHKFSDYFLSSAKIAFGKIKVKYDLDCLVDGKKYCWKNCINLIIGKVPYIGFGIRSLLGELEDDDGKILGMACINTHSPIWNKSLRLWAILLTQLGFAKSPLLPLKGKTFFIRSDNPFPLQAGGDFLGYTKWVKVKVKRKQKVLMID